VKVGGEERMRLMWVARQEVGWRRERQRVMYWVNGLEDETGDEEEGEVVPCPNHLEEESTALVVFPGRGVTSLTSLCHWTTY